MKTQKAAAGSKPTEARSQESGARRRDLEEQERGEGKLRGKTRGPKPQTKTYSLWLMPGGQVYRRLRGIILKLSREYSTPVFKPHVTLLGRIVGPRREVLAKSAQLARSMRPLWVQLGALDGLDEYYRCLFVRAAKTGPLKQAYRAALRIFSLEQRPAYMPHLSLMYGDFPSRLKAQIIRRLGGRFNLGFKVRSLHLYSTAGQPRSWRQVKAFDLPGLRNATVGSERAVERDRLVVGRWPERSWSTPSF